MYNSGMNLDSGAEKLTAADLKFRKAGGRTREVGPKLANNNGKAKNSKPIEKLNSLGNFKFEHKHKPPTYIFFNNQIAGSRIKNRAPEGGSNGRGQSGRALGIRQYPWLC